MVVAMTKKATVIDLIQAFYPLSRERGSKKSHSFEGFDQWRTNSLGIHFVILRLLTKAFSISLVGLMVWLISFSNHLLLSLSDLASRSVPLSTPVAAYFYDGDVADIKAKGARGKSAPAAASSASAADEKSEENKGKSSSKKRPLSPSSSQPPVN